jgi:hypothetical protein
MSEEKRFQFELDNKLRLQLRYKYNVHKENVSNGRVMKSEDSVVLEEQTSTDDTMDEDEVTNKNIINGMEEVRPTMNGDDAHSSNVLSFAMIKQGGIHSTIEESLPSLSMTSVPPTISFFSANSRSGLYIPIKENEYPAASKVRRLSISECQCKAQDSEDMKNICNTETCLNRQMQEECSAECGCGPECGNRKLQQREEPKLDVVQMELKGAGVVAEAAIPKGSFICEYVGEVISKEELDRRNRIQAETNNPGVSNHRYYLSLSSQLFIDARFKGGIARFINHSCKPNARIDKWRVCGYERIGIFAITDVFMGDEITYDYDFRYVGEFEDPQPCFCGEANCRKWMGISGKTSFADNHNIHEDSFPSEAQNNSTSAAQSELQKASAFLNTSVNNSPSSRSSNGSKTPLNTMQVQKCLAFRNSQQSALTDILSDRNFNGIKVKMETEG